MNLNEIPAWSDIESQPWFAELTPEEKQQSLTKWQGDMMQFAKDPKEKFAVAATSKAKARSFFGEEMPDDPIADALQRRQKDLEDIGSRYDAFSKGELEEDDEEVLTLNDTLKGNTPYSVIKGRLFVSPQLVWDKAAYEKVVNEAPVDEDERVLAMSAYDGSKERAAEGVVNSLGYTDEAFRDFAAKGFKEGKSNATILDEWKANNKLPEGILGSLRGVGRQAYFGLRSGLSGLERAMGGLGGFFGSESAQKYAEESGKEAQSYMQRTLGEGPEFIGELTSGAVSIIPTIAAGAAASFFTEGAALPAAASITAGAIQSAGATQAETYEFYRNQGLDHANALAESRVDGLVSGLITGAITHYAGKLGDKIGLGKGIEGLFSGPASKIASKLTQREISESLKAGAKAVGGSFLQEGSEELLDQAAQDAYSMIKRDPTLTLAEAINNALQAGKVGAVLGGAAEAGKLGLNSLLNSAKFSVPTTEQERALEAKFEVPAAVKEEIIASPEVQQKEQNVKTAADVVKETAPVAPQTAAVLAGITEEKAGELAADVVVKTGDALATIEAEAPVVDETPLVVDETRLKEEVAPDVLAVAKARNVTLVEPPNEFVERAWKEGVPGDREGFVVFDDTYVIDPRQLPEGAIVGEDFQSYALPNGEGRWRTIFMDVDGTVRVSPALSPDLEAAVAARQAEAPAISPKPPVSPAVETAPIGETQPPAAASMPMMVTREMNQQLADLGYSRKERNALRPEQAAAIIAAGVRKEKPVSSQPPQGQPVETPTNALPISPATPSLPREERPEMGLQQVGEGNAQPEKVAETRQEAEEVAAISRVAHETDTMPLKDLVSWAEAQGVQREVALEYANGLTKSWAKKVVDKANSIFNRAVELGFFPAKISKDGKKIVATGGGLNRGNRVEVDHYKSPIHAAWIAAHEFSHSLFPTALIKEDVPASLRSKFGGKVPSGLGVAEKSLQERVAVDFANWLSPQVFPEHAEFFPKVNPDVASFFESFKEAQQTPSPPTTGAVPTKTLPAGQEVTPRGVASPGVARDTSKPEQQTPQEFYDAMLSEAARLGRARQIPEMHKRLVEKNVVDKSSVSSSAVDAYGIKLPEGYVKQGELYVYEKTQPLPKGDAAGERGAVAPAPAVEPAPKARPVSQPVQAFRDAVSQMSPTAQAKWTPELRATAEAYLDSGGTTGLQGLSDVQQKVVGRYLPEEVKAAFDAEDARKRAQRNKLPDHRESSLPPTPGKQIRKIGKGAMESVPVVLDEIAKVIPNIRDLVEVRESVEGEPDAEGFYDPQADKAVVLVNNVYLKPQHGGSQEAALRETITHELLHRGFAKLRQTNPQLFEQFEAYSLADTNDAQFEALVRRGYSMYSNWKDDPAQNQKAREEIFIRKAVVDLNFKGIEAIKSPTSLASQFFSWLRGLLNKLLGRKVDDETLLHWSRVFLNAAQADFIEKTPGERMHAFAGEKAIENLPEERRQFMRDSLETAKAMAAAGKDSEEIRAVTGWFPGKYDGKMRWELPDDKVTESLVGRFSVASSAKETFEERDRRLYFSHPKSNPEFFVEPSRRSFFGRKTYEAFRRSPRLDRLVRDNLVSLLPRESLGVFATEGEANAAIAVAKAEFEDKKTRALSQTQDIDIRLKDVLFHPELFNAYPDLKEVRVTMSPAFFDLFQGVQGWFQDQTNTINVTPYAVDKKSTLLHEIQHWIQREEGFARGTSPLEAFSGVSERDIKEKARELAEKIREQKNTLTEYMRNRMAQLRDATTAEEKEIANRGISTISTWFKSEQKTLEDLESGDLNKISTIVQSRSGSEFYNRVAGEIEARDVQARQKLTPEQRAATAPYSSENIAPEDAIVMFGGGGAQMSMASPEKYARHAELEAKHNAGTITPEETAEAQALVEEAAKNTFPSLPRVTVLDVRGKPVEVIKNASRRERKSLESDGMVGEILLPSGETLSFNRMDALHGEVLNRLGIRKAAVVTGLLYPDGFLVTDRTSPELSENPSTPKRIRSKYRVEEVGFYNDAIVGAWDELPTSSTPLDPFTGVPLEQRFQPTSPDIRYSLGEPPDMQAEADALREVTPSSQALDKFRETFGTPRQDVGQVLGKKEGSVYTQAQVAPLSQHARNVIGFDVNEEGDPVVSPKATQKALDLVSKLLNTKGYASRFNTQAAKLFEGTPVDPEIASAVLVQELQAYANRLSASSPKAEDQILKAALTPFYNTVILGNYLTLRTAGRALQAAGRVSNMDDARKSREEAEKAVNKEITKQLGDEALPAAEGMDKAGVEGGVDAIKDDIPAPADPTLRLLDLAVESLDEVAKADAEAVFEMLLDIAQLEELVAQDEKVGSKAMSILRSPNLAARNYPTDPAERKALLAQKKAEVAEKLAKLRSSLEGAKPETKKKVKERATKAGGKAKTAPKVSDKEEDPITKEINALAAELGTLSKLDQAGLDVVKQIAKKLVAKFQPAKLDTLKDKVEAVVYKYVQNAERLELAEFSEKMTADLDAIGLKKPELQEALVAKAWAYHFAAPTKAVQALTAKMKSAERADRGGPESVANVRKAINGAVNSTEENRDAFVTRLTDQLVALGVEAQTAEAAAKAAFEYRAKQADKKIERVMETLRLGKRRALLKSFQNTKEADRTEEWQRATLKAAFVEAGLTNKQAEKGADKAMQEAEAIFATAEMKVAEIKQRSVQKFLDSLASVEDETPVTKTKQDNLRSVFKDATLDEEFNEAVLMDRFQTLGATEAQAKALVEKVAEVREDKAEALAEAKRKQVNKVIDATYKRIAQLESGTPSEKAKKQESLRNAVGAAIKAKEFDEAAFRASVASFGASEPQVETLVQNVKKLRQLGESKPLSKAKLRQFLLSFPKNVLANPEQREALLRSFLKGKEYSEAEINRIVPQVLRDFDTGYQKARKAYLEELEKKLKPKQGQKESKQDQQNRKMLNALRSGLADTTSETSVALAKSLGFEAFRPQDDHILSKLDEEMRKLREQDRISDANAKFVQIRDLLNRRRPPRDFMQVAAQGWITSALSSLSNFAVNVWAPLGEAGVRFTSDILRAAATGKIDEIPLYLEAAIQALKSMPPRAKFAFKTDTFTNSVNTLIADMASMKDELQRALNTYRSKDSSKLAKAAAAGRILFTIGDLSRRVLSTVDDTWYTALSSYIGSSNLIKDLRDAKLPKAAVQAIAFHANNDAIHQAQAEHATLDAVSQFVESLRGKTEEEIDAGLEYLGLNDASVTQAQADYIQEIVSALQSLRIRSGATGDDLVKRALKEISNFKAAVNVRAVELGQARTKELLATALTEVGQTPQQIEEAQRNYDENAKKAASFGMGLHRVEGVPSYDIMGKAVQIVDAMGRGAVTTSPLLGRMMVGFFGIPLNLLNKSLWFTPYGLGRYFLAKWQMAKNPEEKFYEYSMSSQREMSQRVNEIIIGHTIMAAAFALGAIRDQEDEEGEGLYITLGGPSNKTEYDAWYARGFRKFSFCYKTKDGSVAAVPYGRGMGEVLKMPLMLLGAFDDMRLNKKLGDREDMSSIIEYLNSAAAGIGNQATFLGAKNTVGAFAPDKIGANTASSLAYAVSNLVPFNGLDRSIAALAVGPPDRSRTGAILANIPIARWLATDPAINVFGDKWGNKSDANFAVLWDRQWNQGLIPLNISAPLTGQDKRLYGFIGERLIGPSPALRGALELRNGYVTDKQWYDYSIYRGQALKREMLTQLDRLRRMDDDSLSKAIAELSTKATKKAKDRFNYK